MGSLSRQFSRTYSTVRRKNLLSLIRLEFLCKGLVYLMTGVLAVMAALYGGEAGSVEGTVLHRVAQSAPGMAVLALITASMFTYAIWRFLCAFSGSGGRRRYRRTVWSHVAQFGIGVIYTVIALCALGLLLNSANPMNIPTKTGPTSELIGQTSGRIASGTIGISMIAGGILQVRRGFREKFRRDLRTLTLSPMGKRWTRRAGKWGHAARGVVFGLTGVFLLFAAGGAASGEDGGLEQALETLIAEPFGQSLLLVIAAGLACYGVWCMVEARYRRVPY